MESWKLSELFNRKPEQWGLRGDPYFWDYLKEKADQMAPVSSDELEQWIMNEHILLSGENMTAESEAYVEQFAHGGMSTGRICGGWWLDTAIPLLKGRLYGMSCMGELVQYLAGIDCSNWNEEEWEKAEKEWADFPKDSDEYIVLSILRNQRERKLAYDEQLRLEEAAKIVREMANRQHDDDLPEGVVCWGESSEKDNAALGVLLKGISERDNLSFSDVIEKAIKEFSRKLYGENESEREISVSAICERAHMSRKIWDLMVNYNNGTKNRDYLLALAIALHMNSKMTEDLFESCRLNLKEAHLSVKEQLREGIILFYVNKDNKPISFDVNTINDYLCDWSERLRIDPPFDLLEPTKET